MFSIRDIFNSYGKEALLPAGFSAEIKSVTSDSRDIKPGTLFVAIKGHASDGHTYIDDALSMGAVAVVITDRSYISDKTILVDNSREFLSFAASYMHGYPSRQLSCVGVTGTNGKTSISYILEHLALSLNPSVMGTVSHRCNGKVWKTKLTTPGPEELHSRIKEFVQEKSKLCLMEVSSIAIDQKRTEDVSFDGYIFTNLSHDHMDYHKTWDNYVSCKEEFFSQYPERSSKDNQWAIINGDDEAAKKFNCSENLKVITYGFEANNDCVCKVESLDADGTCFTLTYLDKKYSFGMELIGQHNIYNMTASILAAMQLGLSVELLQKRVKNFGGIPGRLEKAGSEPYIFVDYAHTDDALKNVLKTINAIKDDLSKVIIVFGCGGDRDKSKRPKMMKAAVEQSDIIVVTSDNPRTEKPEDIIKDILANTEENSVGSHIFIEVDRAKAINQAISLASSKDIILIAGKGHEDYQEINGERKFFDDVLVVKESLGINV